MSPVSPVIEIRTSSTANEAICGRDEGTMRAFMHIQSFGSLSCGSEGLSERSQLIDDTGRAEELHSTPQCTLYYVDEIPLSVTSLLARILRIQSPHLSR